MRTLFRLVAPVAAAVMIVLAGSSTAFAARSSDTYSLDAAWCFDDAGTLYCYDIQGEIRANDTSAGSLVTVHTITRTTVTEGGVVVGESKSVAMEVERVQRDGTVVIQSGIHTRAVNDDQACNYRLVIRLVDYTATVINESWSCGGPDGGAA